MSAGFTPWEIIPADDIDDDEPFGDGRVVSQTMFVAPKDGSVLIKVCDVGRPNVWDDEKLDAAAALAAAAPELYALGERALHYMEQSLQLLLESHCLLSDDLAPMRDTLEEDAREEVERLEAEIASAGALLAKARGEA